MAKRKKKYTYEGYLEYETDSPIRAKQYVDAICRSRVVTIVKRTVIGLAITAFILGVVVPFSLKLVYYYILYLLKVLIGY